MEEIKYQGKILEIVEFEVSQAGKTMIFEKARRSPGVRLIVRDGTKILLTKEDRHEVGGYDYRLPGGKVIDKLADYNAALASGVDIKEAAKEAAVREAREEAGLAIEKDGLSFIHKSVCGTTVEWDLFYFAADTFGKAEQEFDEGEDITATFYEEADVRRMCLDGTISEERSALVLLKYLSAGA